MSAFDRALTVCVPVALIVVGGGCTPATEVPTPPDLASTASIYDAPTGTIDASNLSSFLGKATSELSLVDSADPIAFLSAISSTISSQLSTDSLPENDAPVTSAIEVDAVLTVNQTCLAWESSIPIDANANGSLSIRTVIDQSVLSRVLWGTASHCRLTAAADEGGTDVSVDGAIGLYRYDSLSTDPANAEFLVRVDGTISSASDVVAALDFRISPDLLEIRVPLESGDVIALLKSGKIGVRAANGTFWCDDASSTCTDANGSSLGF
jgi:hypothetical protein